MRILILGGIGILLIGCNNAVPPETVETAATELEAEVYRYWPSQGQAQIIYEVETQSDDAYQVQYPVITNLDASHPVSQAVNQILRQNLDTFKTEANTFFNDSEAGFAAGTAIPWDYSIEWLGGRYDRSLWSLAFQIYTYQGGDQGRSFTQTFNYAAADNRIINFTDFFNDEGYQAPLLEKIKQDLIEAKTERWLNSGQSEAYDPNLDETLLNLEFTAALSDAWVVSERNEAIGFLFFFAPFEVGSAAEGSYEVFVPLTLLEPWLKPEFSVMFD